MMISWGKSRSFVRQVEACRTLHVLVLLETVHVFYTYGKTASFKRFLDSAALRN